MWDLGVDKEVDSHVEDNHTKPNQIVQVGACEPYQPAGGEGVSIWHCCCVVVFVFVLLLFVLLFSNLSPSSWRG